MKRRLSMLLALLALLVMLFSCKRIPLYDPEADVYLTLDYPKGAEALPEMVRVCFYHPETHELVAETFLAQEGGFVDVASGVYDAEHESSPSAYVAPLSGESEDLLLEFLKDE